MRIHDQFGQADFNNKADKEDKPLFRISSAAGVTLICEPGDTMKWWIHYIVERGGIPHIERMI